MRQPFTTYPVWKKRTGHAIICGWLGFCHGVPAGNFLKSLSVSFSPVLRSVNWLPVRFLHSKVAPRIHFRPAAQTCPDRSGQVCLFCRQRQNWNLCRFINIHIESCCFFFPLLPFLTIPLGSFIFLNIQQKYSLRTKYLSNAQLEGPSRLWLKSPETNDKHCCSTTANTSTAADGKQR